MGPETKAVVASAAANGKNGHSLISDEKFRQLYGLALRLRLTAQERNGTGGSLRGREARLAGVVADLRAGDTLIVESGADLLKLMDSDVAEQVCAPESPDMADALAGAASDRLRGNGRVTVVFLPEGRRDALLQEAQKMAAAAKLAVLFIEDEVPASRANGKGKMPGTNGASDGVSGGISLPEIPVDAQDVVAMYRVAHESMSRARRGSGPTRIVCTRWMPGAGKRQKAEDAIGKLEQWLESRGLPAQDWRREIAAERNQRG